MLAAQSLLVPAAAAAAAAAGGRRAPASGHALRPSQGLRLATAPRVALPSTTARPLHSRAQAEGAVGTVGALACTACKPCMIAPGCARAQCPCCCHSCHPSVLPLPGVHTAETPKEGCGRKRLFDDLGGADGAPSLLFQPPVPDGCPTAALHGVLQPSPGSVQHVPATCPCAGLKLAVDIFYDKVCAWGCRSP